MGPWIPICPLEFIGFGTMDAQFPYEFIAFGTMGDNFPMEIIGLVHFPCQVTGFGAMDA